MNFITYMMQVNDYWKEMQASSVSVNQSNLRPKVNTNNLFFIELKARSKEVDIISVDKVQAAIIICTIAEPISRRPYYILPRIIPKTRRRFGSFILVLHHNPIILIKACQMYDNKPQEQK